MDAGCCGFPSRQGMLPCPVAPIRLIFLKFSGESTTMRIAVMPGDGVGWEVIPAGLKVLRLVASRFGFEVKTTDYPLRR